MARRKRSKVITTRPERPLIHRLGGGEKRRHKRWAEMADPDDRKPHQVKRYARK